MTKTMILAATLAAALSTASYAQTAPGGASVGTSGGATVAPGGGAAGTTGGATINTPGGGGVNTGIGGGASGGVTTRPQADTQSAQQPGVGVDTRTNGAGTITPPRR